MYPRAMNFHRGIYDAYLVAGQAPWTVTRWKKVAAALEPLMDPALTAVRSLQYEAGTKIAFGKLGWNDHAKWTAPSKSRQFGSAEIWSPSWNRCVKRDRAPDAFFGMYAPALSGAKTSYGAVVLLAVTGELDGLGPARAIAETMKAELFAHRRGAWARTSGTGFTDSLQDLLPFGAFRDDEPGPLKPAWKPVRRPGAS